MSLDLGTAHWQLVDVVDGFALVTHVSPPRSRWVDVRTWPAKLLPVRDEWTRAVCAGATLAGWKAQQVFTWQAPDKRRTEVKLPAQHGYRAVGMLDGKPVVVPGALDLDGRASPLAVAPSVMIFDGAWKALAAAGGAAPALSAIVPLDDGGALVVWAGRVLRHERGALVETDAGDLPGARVAARFVPLGDGFVTVAGGKLVWVRRGGKQRDDHAVGKLRLVDVARYEDRYLVREPGRFHLYDPETRHAERLDLGSSADDPDTLFAAPCGLLGLVDGRHLVRYRV